MHSEAEVVLDTLSEVEGLDDVQEIVDRVCRCVVDITPYRLALLSLYFEPDIYVGLEGGSERLRRRFVESARNASPAGRARKREAMWSTYRVPGTNLVWIPEGSDLPFSGAFEPSEEDEGAEWRPNDRLMCFVRGTGGQVHGILSLDRPTDGKRPDPDDLGELRWVDRLMTLMGAVIHNKYLAAKLRESEQRYAAVVEQGHNGILITREGRILFANRRIGEMADEIPQVLVGRTLSSLVRLEEVESFAAEPSGRLLRRDGSTLEIALRKSSINYGGATATLVSVVDISERQRILAQLMRAQKLESVGTLASGIAHDFNNLLSGIVGYASLLETRMPPNDPAQRYVAAIQRATRRASGVTQQLRGIARDDAAQVAPFAIPAMLEELSRFLDETLDPGIHVKTHCEPDLPPVLGDETQIHQALLNVCLNARDAMPNGGCLLLGAGRSENDGVRIEVTDSGTGMDAATLTRIFDPFFTTKEAGHGTGLGLYMAYRILERHGGSIDVSSAPGEGTSVELILPGHATAPAEVAKPRRLEPGKGAGSVLLVDDEDLVRDVGGEMLRRLGYTVITATDGRQAVRAVMHAPTNLRCVILDIAMPNMNGWDAARLIRERRPDLPLIVSSGHDLGMETGNLRGVSVAASLKKPYGLSELRAALEEAARFTASSSA